MTGGSAVLHRDDLTYSVVAPLRGRAVIDAYTWVAQGLIAGLAILGIPARVVEHRAAGGPRGRPGATQAGSGACFSSLVGADLEVGDRKICGSAQVRRRGWFLQHGSIPITDVRDATADLLGGPQGRWACLDELSPGTGWDGLADALVEGFSRMWGPYREVEDFDFLQYAAPAQQSGGIS
jgi:hypothetical protein